MVRLRSAGENLAICGAGSRRGAADRRLAVGDGRRAQCGLRARTGTGGSIDRMTDISTDPQAAAPAFDAQRRATELAILDSLRAVVDPEIGMNVVELALIKQIILGTDETEIKMILTTPFCPYAGSMIQQVKEQAESVVEHDVKVTLLAERWDPRDAGLMW
jgi:metal-sulfur cluster biosynthetic enzyme